MPSNLPENQKTNWLTNEVVMPVDTNGWGTAINKLKKAIPVYASCGNFYKATYSNNIYQLTPLTLSDNTTNEVVNEYVEGMTVVFQCPANNLVNCSINVNSLGVKSIKSVYNTNLEAGILKQGAFIELKYDKINNYFKFEQDLSKADINFGNINNEAKTVIDTRIDNKLIDILELLYPIGAIYIGTTAECPLATLGIGTWVLKGGGRVLQGSDNNHNPGTLISASLPTLTSDEQGYHNHNRGTMNITGAIAVSGWGNTVKTDKSGSIFSRYSTAQTGKPTIGGDGDEDNDYKFGVYFNASKNWTGVTNSTGNHSHSITWSGHVGTTVQPDAYVVNIWERVE